MDRKDAILKSVLKLVNREGFYHLNMKKIASEASVATGTIYVYFKGKEELINELYRMIVKDFNQYVLNGYSSDRSFKDNFYKMLENAVNFYLEEPDSFSFIEQYTYAPFLFKETREENFMLLLPLYKMMREAKKKKIIKNLPDPILITLIHGPLTTIMKMYLAHKMDLNKRSIQQKFFDACWESITVPGIVNQNLQKAI